ncbi:MAG: phosphatase PAP2 family protein [Acidobacteriota bacterium]|nr:MAG: phosphatase PAP2 family protein [Acidobacteriota bacterium]
MFPLDRQIFLLVNDLVGRSETVFEIVLLFCGSLPLAACVAVMLALWWTNAEGGRRGGALALDLGQTGPAEGLRVSRRRCVALAIGVALAFVCTRLIAFTGDFERPLGSEALRVPIEPDRWNGLVDVMTGYGAFPSDQAALFFAVAVALFAWSRRAGVWGLIVASSLSIGRIAVGFHYPSDVVVGGMIGAVFGGGSLVLARRSPEFFDLLSELFDDHPTVMYPALFVMALDFTQHFRLVFRAVFYLVLTLFTDA